MKKIIGIIAAIALFIASLATNIYYFVDGDASTTGSVSEVVKKGTDVVDAFKADSTTTATTNATAQ